MNTGVQGSMNGWDYTSPGIYAGINLMCASNKYKSKELLLDDYKRVSKFSFHSKLLETTH